MYLRIMAFCFPFLGVNFILNGIVRASGAMYQVLVLNIISFWVLRFPLTSLFSNIYDEVGIAIGMGASFVISSVLSFLYYRLVIGVKKSYSVNLRYLGGVVMRQRKKKRIYMQVATLTMLMVIVLVSVSVYTSKHDLKDGKITRYLFTNKVEQYRSVVEKHAKEHEVEEHVDV